MHVKLRASSRQVTLFPDVASNEGADLENAKPELIDALADLLLEALGVERDKKGGDREPQDHR